MPGRGSAWDSLIRRINCLMSRFDSLLGQNKFPVPMRRELRRKPLNILRNCEPIAALGGPDEQNSLYWTERLSPRGSAASLIGTVESISSPGWAGGAQPILERREMAMTPLRRRMIEDMNLAGLASGSQQIYIKSVRRLASPLPAVAGRIER